MRLGLNLGCLKIWNVKIWECRICLNRFITNFFCFFNRVCLRQPRRLLHKIHVRLVREASRQLPHAVVQHRRLRAAKNEPDLARRFSTIATRFYSLKRLRSRLDSFFSFFRSRRRHGRDVCLSSPYILGEHRLTWLHLLQLTQAVTGRRPLPA